MREMMETTEHEQGKLASAGLFIASVGKAFQVLETFAEPESELSLTEVSDRCNVGRSAVQRILFTLTSIGYLIQDQQSRRYRLSPKILALTRSYATADRLRAKAQDVLERVNRECEETVNLTILDDTEVVYVSRLPSKHIVSVNLSVGVRLPAFATAPGRAILANLSEKRVDEILAKSNLVKMTEATETRIDKLKRILRDVKRNGYALSNQEGFVGDISVAAPVFDESGTIVAAINIAVASPRWKLKEVRAKLVPLVMDAAAQVTTALAG